MKDDALIISLAYPETIVKVAKEWYSPYLHYFGIGRRNYVRAGHAALILIKLNSDTLEYFDFGRYITPDGFGRLRSAITDHELEVTIKPIFKDDKLQNIDEILKFFATNPSLTHGQGTLIASICSSINYDKAKSYLNDLQNKGLIRYAAFIKDASNCARLVLDVLKLSSSDKSLVKKLNRMSMFTPSTVGTVVAASSDKNIYQLDEAGQFQSFGGSVKWQNVKLLLDKLKDHSPSLTGTINPIDCDGLNDKAQWMGGIGAGAWFELLKLPDYALYRFKRISPQGLLDTDSLFRINNVDFDIEQDYKFLYQSTCNKLFIEQGMKVYTFHFIKKSTEILIESERGA